MTRWTSKRRGIYLNTIIKKRLYRRTSNSPTASLSLFTFKAFSFFDPTNSRVQPHCVHFPTPHVHRRVNSLKTQLPFKDRSDWVQRKKKFFAKEKKERIDKRTDVEKDWGFFSRYVFIGKWKGIKDLKLERYKRFDKMKVILRKVRFLELGWRRETVIYTHLRSDTLCFVKKHSNNWRGVWYDIYILNWCIERDLQWEQH